MSRSYKKTPCWKYGKSDFMKNCANRRLRCDKKLTAHLLDEDWDKPSRIPLREKSGYRKVTDPWDICDIIHMPREHTAEAYAENQASKIWGWSWLVRYTYEDLYERAYTNYIKSMRK